MTLKILAVANWNPAEKSIPWAMQRLEGLRAAGADVELLTEECVRDRRGFVRLWRRLNERLAEERFDLVVPLYGSILGLVCAAQRRVPCALTLVGSDLNGSRGAGGAIPLGSRPSMVASQLAAALAAGVSVCGPEMKRAIWWPRSRTRAEVTPDGTDLRRFQPQDRLEARRARGLPLDGHRIAFVSLGGDRVHLKRLDLARAAVARLPGAVLDVFENVPFDEMPRAYAACDALVMTSFVEGSPNCVREALACALPVVSVPVGDVPDLLAGLTNCAVVPADPDALATALAAALTDGRGCPEGPTRMAARSLDAAAQRFLRFYTAVARNT